MKRKALVLTAVAGVFTALAITAAAAQGGADDPLVTLSYLTDIFTPKMEEKVTEVVKANETELSKQLDIAISSYETRVDEALKSGGGATFQSKTLSAKETATWGVGRELLLVSGSAKAVGTLTDTTAGTTVKAGTALTAGHLYITAADESGLTATASAQVMVR